MLGFGKNKKTDTTADTNGSVVKKKGKESMGSVLEESVVENLKEDIQSCVEFKISDDKYLAVKLHADDIGGINKITRKNEVIGSIIEAIRSSRIKSIITEDLLNSDSLIIILDRDTVDAMNEFEILVNTKYDIVYLNANGDIEETNEKIGFADIIAISSGSKSVKDVLNPNDDEDDTLGESHDDDEEEDEETLDSVEEDDEEVPEYEDIEPIEAYEEVVQYEDPVDEDLPVYTRVTDDNFVDDEESTIYDEELVEDNGVLREKTEEEIQQELEEPVISEELQNSTITRILNKGDLDLEIDGAIFDSYFADLKNPILFDTTVTNPDSLLDREVCELRRAANVQIQELHQRNLAKARTMYMNLISLHAETISNSYSFNNPSYWGSSVKKGIEEKKKKNLENIKSLIFEKQQVVKDEWQKELDAVGERGRHDAIRRYVDENKSIHDARLSEIENTALTDIEFEAASYIKNIEDERKREAIASMEAGITGVMELVTNNYNESQREERLLYEQLSLNIKDFITSHRADETDRIRVLNAQQMQQSEAEKVRADLSRKLDETIQDYELALESKYKEIEELRARHIDDLQHKDIITENQAKEFKLKIENLEAKNSEYIDKLANLDKEKEEKYKSEMEQLRGQLNAENDKITYMEKREKKLSILVVGISIIGMLTAGLGGYIFGTQNNNNATTSSHNPPPYIIERWHSDENGDSVDKSLTVYSKDGTESKVNEKALNPNGNVNNSSTDKK